MSLGGLRRAGERERKCLRREIMGELPKLRLGEVMLWKEVDARTAGPAEG
jgi:8-oxo-dGTP diphosphatase